MRLHLGLAAKTERILNEYRRDGCELCAVYRTWHYLKRPVEHPTP